MAEGGARVLREPPGPEPHAPDDEAASPWPRGPGVAGARGRRNRSGLHGLGVVVAAAACVRRFAGGLLLRPRERRG